MSHPVAVMATSTSRSTSQRMLSSSSNRLRRCRLRRCQRLIVSAGNSQHLQGASSGMRGVFRLQAASTDDFAVEPVKLLGGGVAEPAQPVYRGVYGNWVVTKEDETEVFLYRLGLNLAAGSFVAGTTAAALGANDVLDPLYAVGSAGFGLSLLLIHVYVTPLKRFVQLCWALGCAGSLYIAITQPEPVPIYVLEHPISVWAVGPLFAALTGVALKEGLCYGKAEAAGLFAVVPITLLGHLCGMPDGPKAAFLATWCALFAVFAGRKWTQEVKDDIGDKSIFVVRAMPPDEQAAIIAKADL